MRSPCVRGFLAAMAVLTLALAPARAAEGKPYVVLVGVGTYEDAAIKARPTADADVKALYDLLTDPKYSRAGADRIKLLTSDAAKDPARNAQPATRENILRALAWAFTNAEEDDTVLVAWVGQGGPIGDRPCYFAADSTFKNRAKDAIGAAEFEHAIDKTKSTKLCFLLDVHFRGYDAGGEKVSEVGLEKLFEEFDGQKEDAEGPAKPLMMLSATDGLTPPLALEKQGLFMAAVLDGLKGAADSDGGEPDGLVTVDELFTYVRKEVPQRASKLGKRETVPVAVRRSTHFALTHNPAVEAALKERLEKFDQRVQATGAPAEVAKEGHELLASMPRREAQRILRKQYTRFAEGALSLEDLEKQRSAYKLALKVPKAEAEAFADKVLEVAEIVQRQYVKPVKLPDLVASAIKGVFRAADEKLPKDLAERLEGAKKLDDEGLRALLIAARNQLGTVDELRGPKAATAALERMLHGLDPYSNYIPADDTDEFRRQTQQDFIGVGIQIQKDFGRDMVRVSTPLKGTAAYKAGILAGDLIVKITNVVDRDGKPLAAPESTSTKGLSISDVVKLILGKEGTKVILTVERETETGPKELRFELTRSKVQVETVLGAHRKENDSWDFYIDQANKIAYVRLTQFALNTERDLKAAMRGLEKQGINGLILDLRFNPGGYLDTAVAISDLFVDDGLIVTIRPRETRPREYKGRHENSLLNFPLVVLVNGYSASASEILSACIQDHERGIVMGERSYGKGSVQNIMDLSSGDALKLTTASFWRPSGKNLHRFPNSKEGDDWGVHSHPAYTLKLSPAERSELLEHLRKEEGIPRRDMPKKEVTPTFVDRQLDMALEYLRKQVTAKANVPNKGG